MTQTYFSVTGGILAPPQVVWSVMTDLERWQEWTSSVSRIKRLSPGPLEVGSRARIHQPKLPPACWRVTELSPGSHFTWVSVVPGVRVIARHSIASTVSGCRVALSISYEGLFGAWLARWTHALNERYLTMEANGLKTRCAKIYMETRSRMVTNRLLPP